MNEIVKRKELLTSSRMDCLLSCPRKHYWRYELGLQSVSDAAALRFGSAWHAAMEARWKGADFDAALSAALPENIELDELQCATIAGLLAGYYEYYPLELVKIQPEIEFCLPLQGSRTFEIAGKIDGVSENCMIEHKTTSDSVAPDSDYWMRLRFNGQIMQYLLALRALGYDIRQIIYDVVKKPGIAPKNIPTLDESGLKIVLDTDGNRVFKKDGSPRESGDTEKGYTVQSRLETPEEFSQRLFEDCKTRPEFYFARREVPVLDCDLKEFEVNRLEIARAILNYRRAQKKLERPEQAWPRNCGSMTCNYCQFNSFCLQSISVDTNNIPAGFKIGQINSELTATTKGV